MNTKNLIDGNWVADGIDELVATNPVTQENLPGRFRLATTEEVNLALMAAFEAWKTFRYSDNNKRAQFLRTIADEIESLGDTLVNRVMEETGLPEARVKGERGRTCGQLRMFADMVEEGSWVDATIDEAIPGRQPIPRPDIRRMKIGIGPVAVFTASNFPLAFSTAGGDTASALAAGCPVVVKAHPSHPGTNALVSHAIRQAVEKCDLPGGVFSTLNGGVDVGSVLVNHPLVKAVAFTGSYNGGKAIMDLAAKRAEPIPVYAEMGSNNPVFILPEKMNSDKEGLADMIASSVNLGAGQFCTNPGLVIVKESIVANEFSEALKKAFENLASSVMLNQSIYEGYKKGKENCSTASGVKMLYESKSQSDEWIGHPALGIVDASDFNSNKRLQDEVFGPFTLLILCEDEEEMLQLARNIHGQLTCTIIGGEDEISKAVELANILSMKCGRLIYNGVPTGVEVSHAMHHGGPFPASSNGMYTSVGTAAIERFARSVCFQNAPNNILPDAIKPGNPLGIRRTINGNKTDS